MKQRNKLIFNSGLLMLLSFLILSTSIFTACTGDLNATSGLKENNTIPSLLDRNSKIQLGKEWDQVQNYYAEQKQEIGNDPNNHQSKLNLALLFIKEARVTGEHGHYYPAALKMVNEIIDSKPDEKELEFQALLTKAGVTLSLHSFAEAKEIGIEALKLNPFNAQAYGVLVDAHVELGEYDQAVKMADKMISIKPDLRSYSRVAYLREIHGDLPGATKAMKLAVEAGFPGTEETAWAMLTLGEMYQLYDQPEAAKTIYNTILESRPDYPFAVAALGKIAFDQGDLDEAEKKTNEAIDIIPEVGFYMQRAELQKIRNEDKAYSITLAEIKLMLQDDVDHGHNMNLEYADLFLNIEENVKEALKYAEMEYAKRPKNIDVNRLLAQIYTKKGDRIKTSEYKKAAMITNSVHPALANL